MQRAWYFRVDVDGHAKDGVLSAAEAEVLDLAAARATILGMMGRRPLVVSRHALPPHNQTTEEQKQ